MTEKTIKKHLVKGLSDSGWELISSFRGHMSGKNGTFKTLLAPLVAALAAEKEKDLKQVRVQLHLLHRSIEALKRDRVLLSSRVKELLLSLSSIETNPVVNAIDAIVKKGKE